MVLNLAALLPNFYDAAHMAIGVPTWNVICCMPLQRADCRQQLDLASACLLYKTSTI